MRINPRELRSDYYRNWGNARRLFLVTAALSNHTLDRRSTFTWGLILLCYMRFKDRLSFGWRLQ